MKISGYEVEFPHQPYGVQLSFMSRVLQTIEHRQNALLEAPTGSGKTLSLLCSALSWQRRLKNEGYTGAWEGRKRDDSNASGYETARTPESCRVEGQNATGQSDCSTVPSPDGNNPEAQYPRRASLPCIYYATRTHSQIGQVVRELKRAGYKPKMAILASRSHYCVHKTVSKKPNLDEECETLLEDNSCKYFSNAQKLFGLQTSSSLQVHDIEDLVKVGQSMQACPYFAARHFKEAAELIFCPYNYILDPVIRRAVQIDLQDSVIILDEAHNIEDICRDAASCELELSTLEEVQKGFEQACFSAGGQDIYGPLVDAVARTAAWLRARAEGADIRQQNDLGKRFEGVCGALELRTELDDAGLCPERVELLWELYEKARASQEQQREAPAAALAEADDLQQPAAPAASQGKKPRVSGFPLGVLSRLLTVLRLLYASDGCDYRLAIQRWWRSRAPVQAKGRRRGRRHAEEDDESSGWVVQLCLWSLNPAVAFRSVSESVRSVILASGTLSPLGSFASELAAEFQVRFEAPHVINARTQVWAGSIAAGPDAQSLVATFEQSRKPAFQDSLGRSIAAIAGVVPDGLLVFFSSYSMMDRLKERWEATGIWAQLQRAKTLVCEPHGTGEAFDNAMKTYYDAIAEGRGAIFFAICRGKVSEGLDFTDANARAVIVVGIPFPNTKDTKVDLKKRYNDEQRRRGSPQLLSGAEWYNQQAFRALNQAIGRCIRHKHDYGGIILLDRRFGDVRNRKDLSCWVRTAINTHIDFGRALEDLTAFFARLQANPPSGKPPAGKPEQPARSGAQQTSAATKSGRQQSSGAAAGVQPGKHKVADTGGSKPVATSQFVTHSQPTLNAVWKKPVADLKRAQRPAPAKMGTDPAPVQAAPACLAPDAQSAEGLDPPSSPAISPPKPGEIPKTQTRGRGADTINDAAWASSLSTSASSQQHAALPASDQHTASHASLQQLTWPPSQPQTASLMQLDSSAADGSQSQQQGQFQASPGATDNAKGRPDVPAQQAAGRSLSRLGSMGGDSGGPYQTPSHGRRQHLQSIPEGMLIPGRPTAHLDQAARSERSAQRLSCPDSVTPRVQQAHASAARAVQHGKQLHSQHAARPANAAQHLMSRPEARDKRGHMPLDPNRFSPCNEQSSPGYLTPGARPEASQMSQHSSAAPSFQQSGASAATRCMSTFSGVAAQIPGAMSGPQPRAMGPMGNLGRPAQVLVLPSNMRSSSDRQAQAPVVAQHGQRQGSCGPSNAPVLGSAGSAAGAATSPGVRPQERPGQQSEHTHAGARHAGINMSSKARRQPGTVPLQQGGGQTSSMATPQRPPKLREQQQHDNSAKACAVQHPTSKQNSTAALAAGPRHAAPQSSGVFSQALLGALPLSVMQAWVQRDLEAARAHLEHTKEEGDSEQIPLADAAAGVLDAFAYAREALEQGEQLPDILGSWACPPVGLQMVAVAYFAEDFHLIPGGCTGHPELEQATGLSHARLEQLLMGLAKLGLEGALQEMQQAYEKLLGLAVDSPQPAPIARQQASCPAAAVAPASQIAENSVRRHTHVPHKRAAPSMAQGQPGPCTQASASAQLLAGQLAASLPESLAQRALGAPQSAAPCPVRHVDARPQAESPRCTHGSFSHVDVVLDSGSESCKSSSKSFSHSASSRQNGSAGSVPSAAAQQQNLQHAARSGMPGKSRLGDKRGQPSKEAGKAVGSGQKRQALSELKSQKVKHSQREQQAWTQGTDDSDDFA